jgi:hypothetical protein
VIEVMFRVYPQGHLFRYYLQRQIVQLFDAMRARHRRRSVLLGIAAHQNYGEVTARSWRSQGLNLKVQDLSHYFPR